MLPINRATIGELWTLLNQERRVKQTVHLNGHYAVPSGHLGGGKKGHGKARGANGYWWSK